MKHILYSLLSLGLLGTPIKLSAQNQIDLILHSAELITMDKSKPQASAIAIGDGKIVAVGNDENVLGLAQSETKIIDLEGRVVMPGFVDAHNHLFNDVELTEEGILANQKRMLENGITTFGNLFSNEDVIALLQAMDAQGLIKIKSSIYLPAGNNCGDILDDWWLNYPSTRDPGEKVRIGGVKIFADGGTCDKLPAISWTYGHIDSQGDLFFDQQTLDMLVMKANDAGYQIALHAQGDRAIRQALNALSQVTQNKNPLRHRIEHNSLVPQDVYHQYGDAGIIPIVWGYYYTCSIEGLSNVFSLDSLKWLEDWRSLIDANPGLPISWHSDAPYLPLNPILNLHSTVTKTQIAEDGTRCQAPDWLLEHAMTTEEALAYMTLNSAYSLDRDSEVGSLETGKFADLIVLSENPLKVQPENLINIEILGTMADGQFVYCSNSLEPICDAINTNSIEYVLNTDALKLSPNPFGTNFRVELNLPSSGSISLDLLGVNGRSVYNFSRGYFEEGTFTIQSNIGQSEQLKPGLYLVQLVKDGELVDAQKVIKL